MQFTLRNRLRTLAVCILISSFGVVGQSAVPGARPNILWIVSEDNASYTVGAYGDPLARTPNIDRLAAEGVLFRRAYAAAPVCAPSRSSIITGRFASGMGTQHMRSRRPLPEGVRFFPEFLRAAGYFTTNHFKTDYNTSTDWSAPWDRNGEGAHSHWRHRKPGQPFFAVFNFKETHESSLHKRERLVTDPAKVRVPDYLPDTPETRADLAQYYDRVSRADAEIGVVLRQLAEDKLTDDTIIFYYSDHGGAVSRSKRFLFENGTRVPLIVRFPVKFQHLAPASPGTRLDELVNLIDLAPTVLSLAGIPSSAQFQGRAFAGSARTLAPAHTFMFRDRMDERYDLARAVTDGRFRYIRNYYPAQPWGQRIEYLWRQSSMAEWASLHDAGRLDANQRRFFEPKGPEELYDCDKDPDNVHNLAGDSAFQPHVQKFREVLRNHLLAIRDTGFMPEPLMIELAGTRSPTVVAADERAYPLRGILDLLDAVQFSRRTNADSLDSAWKAPQAALRYWAVAAPSSAGARRQIESMLVDTAAVVRVAAAEAKLRLEDDPNAWAVLAAAVGDAGQAELQLFALNAAARLSRPVPGTWRPALQQLAESRPGSTANVASAARDLLRER